MASAGGVGSIAAETGEPRDDEARVEGKESGQRQMQGFEHAGTVRVDEDVYVGQEGLQQRDGAGGL